MTEKVVKMTEKWVKMREKVVKMAEKWVKMTEEGDKIKHNITPIMRFKIIRLQQTALDDNNT